MNARRLDVREHQVLRAQDLLDEQTFHVAQQRRHAIEQHGWGIVYGLALRAEAGTLFVLPGLAVDGFGRELVAAAPVPVPLAVAVPGAGLDVWLLWSGDPGREGTGGRSPEGVRPRLTPAADPPRPPERQPDDAGEHWPVLLGRVSPASGASALQVLPAGRRYVRLTGASLTDPAGGARIDLLDEVGDGRWSVQVRLPADDREARLELGPDGALLRGKATVYGDLESGAGVEWAAPAETAPGAAACCIYRATGEAEEQRFQLPPAGAGEGGTASARNRAVVVGPGDAGPVLIVSAQGVHVPGSLIVQGRFQEAPVKASPSDPRFVNVINLKLAQGRGGAPAPARLPSLGLDLRLLAVAEPGYPQTIAIGYAVTNTGGERLAVTLTDRRFGAIRQDAPVAAGETAVWMASRPLPSGAADRLEIAATAQGRAPDGRTVSRGATYVLVLAENPLDTLADILKRKIQDKIQERLRK